ncbi:MAG: manganese efflux pump [Clostridiales bacterium]|nr:manganese efflux pump [Clostridiales bacterium]
MDLPLFLLTGLSLSMDAFAIAIGLGAAQSCPGKGQKLRVALTFGAFQALMPLIGHALGSGMARALSPYDRLIASGLLAALGIKMGYDTWRHPHEGSRPAPRWPLLLAMGVTTSIDALCVGVGYSLIGQCVEQAAPVIGVVTFLICYAGAVVGEKLGTLLARYSGYLGGAILIAIGIKALVT